MISAGERPQTYAFDCEATGTGKTWKYVSQWYSLGFAHVTCLVSNTNVIHSIAIFDESP